MTRRTAAVLLASLCIACHGFGPDASTALLSGTVFRGPVTPVCQVDAPCNAPFSASFEVRRGTVRVAMFHSGSDGSFSVVVPSGDLTIVPTADAPIIDPAGQVHPVTVAPGAAVIVYLYFDTGIR